MVTKGNLEVTSNELL